MNNDKDKKAIIQNIENLVHYGVKAQMPVWIEEMSELTKVICKWSRKYDKLNGDINTQLLEEFKDEITDVTICLDQIKYVIGFMEDELMKRYGYKTDRQAKRIAGELDE